MNLVYCVVTKTIMEKDVIKKICLGISKIKKKKYTF